MTEFDTFCEQQKQAVEDTFKDTEPSYDILPMMVLWNGNKTTIAAIPELGDPEKKPLLSGVIIPQIITETKAYMGALITSSWYIEQKGPVVLIRPSQDPDRREAISLLCFKRNDERLFLGEIVRSNKSPKIKTWAEHDRNRELSGNFTGLGRFTRVK